MSSNCILCSKQIYLVEILIILFHNKDNKKYRNLQYFAKTRTQILFVLSFKEGVSLPLCFKVTYHSRPPLGARTYLPFAPATGASGPPEGSMITLILLSKFHRPHPVGPCARVHVHRTRSLRPGASGDSATHCRGQAGGAFPRPRPRRRARLGPPFPTPVQAVEASR
jgi:hypothetical protein